MTVNGDTPSAFVQQQLSPTMQILPQKSELESWLATTETTLPKLAKIVPEIYLAPPQRFLNWAPAGMKLAIVALSVDPNPEAAPFFPTVFHPQQLQSFHTTKASTTPLTLQSLYHIHWFLKAQPQSTVSSPEVVLMVKTFQAGSHLRLSSVEKAVLKVSQLESPVCWLTLVLMQPMTVSTTVLFTSPQPCQAICCERMSNMNKRGVKPFFCCCIRNNYKNFQRFQKQIPFSP